MRPIIPLTLLGLFLQSAATAQVERLATDAKQGTSSAVVVPGDLALLHTTQLLPWDKDGNVVAKGDSQRQSEHLLKQLRTALQLHAAKLEHVVKLNVAAKDRNSLQTLMSVITAEFKQNPPAVTVVVSDLSHSEALVALDAVAAISPANATQAKFSKSTELPQQDSHVAVLPPGPRTYISGQAATGELLEATRKTMESLDQTRVALQAKKSDIVQVKAFVNPMIRAPEVHREITKYFDQLPVPPLVFIDWKFETPIEIEMIVAGNSADDQRELLRFITPPDMKPSPVFSRVVRIEHGPIIYLGSIFGTAGAAVDAQASSIFAQLKTTLQTAKSDLRHLVKATYYCTDDAAIKAWREIRPQFYDPERPPAASLSKITHTGQEQTAIAIDMIAVPVESPSKK